MDRTGIKLTRRFGFRDWWDSNKISEKIGLLRFLKKYYFVVKTVYYVHIRKK